MITVKDLVKTYKNGEEELVVLKHLSFEIVEKQFVSIVGKSGSGKSTLLYQMSLLDRPTSGKVLYDGQDVTVLQSVAQTQFRLNNIGYVFQDYALIPTLTATEQVMVPLLMQGLSKEDAVTKAHSALDRVDLSDKYENLPSMLSGGQLQRISIARAIAHDPRILYADEPTANLDSETSKVVLDTFLELNKQGQTIVMVTHEKEYAKKSDRIITLLDGKIVRDTKT